MIGVILYGYVEMREFEESAFNLRPAEGVLRTPSGFFQIVKKTRRRFWDTLPYIFSALVVKISGPGHVRSGHVKWPHLIKSLNLRQSYTDWTIALKLSAIATSNSIYKIFISEFWYRWPKVRSILWSLQSQREKIEKRLFWTKPILNTLKHRVTGRIHTLNRKIATSDPSSWSHGHFRSWKVTGSFQQ